MEYQSISQVAGLADIPETTARRYVASFADYIDSRRYGRITKYRVPATVKLLQRLVLLYQSGKTTEEIAAFIADTYLAEREDGDMPTAPPSPALPPPATGQRPAAATATATLPPQPSLRPAAAVSSLPPPLTGQPPANLQALFRQQIAAMEQIAAAIESIAATNAQELADIKKKQALMERSIEERAYIIRPPRSFRRRGLWARAGAGTLLAALSAAVIWWLAVVVWHLTPLSL